MIWEGKVDIVEYTILGNLKLICYIKNGKILKVTTRDGTEITITGASDVLGHFDDQILEEWKKNVKTL